jgi:DNA-binding MarR family transcriptional regulator
MLALWEQSPRTLSGLSAELMLEPATLTPLVKRLEAAGLITRARSAHDERALSIELTDRGRALRADAFAVPQRIIERLGMPVDELEQTRDALNRLIEAARA